MAIFTASEQSIEVVILLIPESSMMSLASTLDTMRAANRISNKGLFHWKIVTLDGQSADLTCGIPVAPLCSLNDSLAGDALFVIAGFNHQKYLTKQNQLLIKQVSRNFKVVGGIEAGSWILARCGLLNQKTATTHWEDQEEFSVQFPSVNLKADRFVIDGKFFTTGGASPTFDFMLHLIRSRYGYPLALEVSSAFIYDGVHSATEPQPLVSLGMLENKEPRVAAAIQIMQRHIDEVISIIKIAERLNLSVRMLEYLFNQTLNLAPGAYYRRLRLQTAHRMVVDTRLKLQEIAIRTGFNSLSSFSRMFKQYYQQSPGQCRKQSTENLIAS
jgi:transcriptional regulator GlxA family with amidase domain